ncbi:hypothetical protein ACFL2Q_10640 [Thermodesulfobacteriota bacterium]
MKALPASVMALLLAMGLLCTGNAVAEDKKSPCDAVVQYMKKGRAIVQQARGEERDKLLAALKEEFGPKMEGAPAQARRQADAFLEVTRQAWEDRQSDSVFRILTTRNAALKACKKTPEEAGF